MIEVSLILTGQEVKITSSKMSLHWDMRRTVDLIKIDIVKLKKTTTLFRADIYKWINRSRINLWIDIQM